MNTFESIDLRLKYKMFTPTGFKHIGIRIFEIKLSNFKMLNVYTIRWQIRILEFETKNQYPCTDMMQFLQFSFWSVMLKSASCFLRKWFWNLEILKSFMLSIKLSLYNGKSDSQRYLEALSVLEWINYIIKHVLFNLIIYNY